MKTASPALISLLNSSDQFIMADLFTITTRFGEVLRYTTTDRDVKHGGNTFTCTGPNIKRGTTKCVLGLEVDTLEVNIGASTSHLLNGAPFVASALSGALDGATFLLERAFFTDLSWVNIGTPSAVGAVIQFTGRVSDVDGTRSSLKVMVKSDLELLNVKMPRNVYEPSCSRVLYDSGCGVNRAAHTYTGKQVLTAGSRSHFYTNLYGIGEGSLSGSAIDLGVITFTSGANAGLSRTVKSWLESDGSGSAAIRVAFPFPSVPQPGDSFNVSKGCPKNMDTCSRRFGNLVRFRGFPFVPAPETIT